MDTWQDWIKLVGPSALVAIVLYIHYNRMVNELLMWKANVRTQKNDPTKSKHSPEKLQAYERMALFLERIKPTSLVRRVSSHGTKSDFEFNLINAIQTEWEHNLSQQIYVNPESWEVIFSTKNAVQSFVKKCSDFLPEDAEGRALTDELIMRSVNEKSVCQEALLRLQVDIQKEYS